MAKGNALSRLDRLDRIQGLLKSGELTTVREISAALQVSPRSIWRDLLLLRNTGVPIEADRGRGGGIRIAQRWSLGRLNLDEEAAIDLLLSVAIAEKMDSPLLLNRLPSVRQRLVAAFAPVHHLRIRQLRKRILIGTSASPRVLKSYRRPSPEALKLVKTAFFEMRRLRINYVDEAGRATTRDIEPQYLYLNVPVWYLLAWDDLRGDVRFFRIDRVQSVEKLQSTFRIRPVQPFLDQAEQAAQAL